MEVLEVLQDEDRLRYRRLALVVLRTTDARLWIPAHRRREQAHLLAGDMDDIRKKVRSAEWRWSDTISSLAGLWNRINGSKRKGRSKK